MNTRTEIIVPLNRLVRSPYNTRKTSAQPSESLAASLEAHGQIHNFVVHEMEGRRSNLRGVADGGRRLASYDLLRKRGVVRPDHPIRCFLISKADAVALSLAANTEREPMHPADEFDAMKALLDSGKTIEEIAAAFGVTPLVVTRRLKLANVAPKFIELYRDDKINLDQLMALALTDDQERQVEVWEALSKHDRSPHAIRAALTADEVDAKRDPIARYVTLKSYEKAGGSTRRDLFSDEDAGYIQDVPLLHRLATSKLERKAAEIAKEGWSWTEVRLHLDWAERNTFSKVPKVKRAPTAEESEQLAALTARVKELQERDERDESDLTDAELDELGDSEGKLGELEESLLEPDPSAAAYAGAIITIDHAGHAEVLRGLVRPEDRKRLAREQPHAAQESTGCDDDAKARSPFSEKLTRNLTAHFTVALQLALARDVNAGLVALAYPLVLKSLGRGRRWETQAARISLTEAEPQKDAANVSGSRAFQSLQELRAPWDARVPSEQVLPWLLQLPQAELLELIAFCVSLSVDCTSRGGLSDEAKQLGHAVRLDMADWWEPTAESFLAHVPKAVIVDSVTQARDEATAGPLGKAKKADAIAQADEMLRGTRWLPSVLRI